MSGADRADALRPRRGEPHVERWIARHGDELWDHLDRVPRHPAAEAILADFLERACRAQHAGNHALGRYGIVTLPRGWTLERLEPLAARVLDPDDAWEYRRLLELYSLLDARALLARAVARGRASLDAEVREAAEEFVPR